MSNFKDYKSKFIGSLIGIPAAVIIAVLIANLRPQPEEILTEFLVQINSNNTPSYSATLKINKSSEGYLYRNGKKSKVSDLFLKDKEILRFQAQLDGQKLTFSGFYQPYKEAYEGLIILNGENYGTWSAQKVAKLNK